MWINGWSQSLIANGGFENHSTCPDNLGQIEVATPWFNPTLSSPDYFNQCAAGSPCWAPSNPTGYQYPHSGNAYAGIVVMYSGNYREYIEIPLTTALTAGSSYDFQMYIVSSDIYTNWSGDVGAYFSDTAVQAMTSQSLPFQPQIRNNGNNIPDSLNWVSVRRTYIATGGERYIIIGNFDDNAHTISSYSNPQAPWQGTYTYIDDVSLTPTTTTDINETGKMSFTAYPNPAGSSSEITFTNPSPGSASEISINNIDGREVARYSLPQWSSVQHVKLPKLAAGVYVARLVNEKASANVKFSVVEN
jgi:hypothetical protein